MDADSDVRAAQDGDRHAFERIVRRHRPLALAYARRWLKDAYEAEDAVQDAFVEAHRSLGQLRAPSAFAAWLRRAVRKHCDRRSRRRTEVPWDPATVDAVEAATAKDPPLDELRRRIEHLPEGQRMVVALHYLAGSSQRDIADFLELPLSTVKKRLHDARKRLAAVEFDPEPSPEVPDRIALFAALRRGDRPAVRRLLGDEPRLLNAPETWSDEEAFAAGVPLAHRQTPLVLAAARGDDAMVRLLLERGAQIDGRCGCTTGETALQAAALHGRLDVVELLLGAGADPRTAAPVLREAIRRGRHDIVARLVRAGVVMPSVDSPVPSALPSDLAATGIKALDLLAPLGSTATVRVLAAAETGVMVLLAELARVVGARGGRTVWTAGGAPSGLWGDLETFAAETGIDGHVVVATDDALERARSLRTGRAQVALVLFASEDRAAVDRALPRLVGAADWVFVVEPWTTVTRDGPRAIELTAPYDAIIVTDPGRAQQGRFPALSIEHTRARTPVSSRHARLRTEVRRLRGDERVDAYLTQPFDVWQHRTGMPGVSVRPEDMLDDVERLLGNLTAFTPEELRDGGRLPR